MLDEACVRLDRAESASVLEEINPLLGAGGFDPGTVTILARNLPFYPGYRFLEMATFDAIPYLRKNAVYKPGDVVIPDGDIASVYALNDRVPLVLSARTVPSYLRFFFSCVHMPEGKSAIVDGVDDLSWIDEPPLAVRRAVGEKIFPVVADPCGPDGVFAVRACLLFRNALYAVSFTIASDGRVAAEGETLLMDDLPVLDAVLES